MASVEAVTTVADFAQVHEDSRSCEASADGKKLEFDADEHENEQGSWSIALRPRNLYKLVTQEDAFHFHKLVGVFVLVHYIYRFVSLLLTGSMGFEKHSKEKLLFFFFMHLVLSWSSFIFHLPPRRNADKPMIWPELRLHNIIFATRSILDAVIHILGLGHIAPLRVAIGFATMIAADLVSNHYRKLELIDSTTMRGMPYPNLASAEHYMKVYYGISQLFATAGVFCIAKKWTTDVELAFSTLFAIQLSALLMTLVRKSILEPAGWHFFYALSLGISWVLAFLRYSEFAPFSTVFVRMFAKGMVAYVIRFRLDVNKYLLWTAFVLFMNLIVVEVGYDDYPFKLTS